MIAGLVSEFCITLKVLATLDREWEGLARHREFPALPLDNYAEVPVMPMPA
jgi:hypothetical protein